MDFIYQIRWRPGIGDPSFMGWLTVAAYAFGMLTSWLAAGRAARAPGLAPGSRGMWLLVTMLMCFLCLNKQLDLQSLATDIGRVLSKEQGWYKQRRSFQLWFVLGLGALSFLATVAMVIRYRTFWKTHYLLASGIVFLVTFVAIRAVSFHHVDVLLKTRVGGMKINWFLELTGIFLIWLAAMWDYRYPQKAPKPAWKAAV